MATARGFLFAFVALSFIAFHAQARQLREVESFSKFTNPNNNANLDKTQVVPAKEESLAAETTLDKQQQEKQPVFIPQTQTGAGYGLYGHEQTAARTPATAANSLYATMPDDSFYNPNDNGNRYESSKKNYNYYDENSISSNSNNNNYEYYNKDSYALDEMNLGGDATFDDAKKERRYPTSNNVAENNRNNFYTGGNSGDVKQEGLSDTRFMENGKYFYDVNDEQKYYQNRYPKSNPTFSPSGFSANSRDVNLYDQYYSNNNNANNVNGYQNAEFRAKPFGGYKPDFSAVPDDDFLP